MKFLNSLRIRTVLSVGIVLMMVLIGYLGYVSYDGINGLSSNSIPLITSNETLMKTALDMRRVEKDFLLYDLKNSDFYEVNSSQNLDQFKRGYEKAQSILIEIEKHNNQMNILSQEQLEDAKVLMTQNHDDFLELVELYKLRGYKEFGMIGELRSIIHDVEMDLNDLISYGDFEIAMLQLRRTEKDYFLRNDPVYIERFTEKIDSFKTLIELSDTDETLKTSLISNLVSYNAKFIEISNLDEEIGRSNTQGRVGEYNGSSTHLLGVLELNNRKISENVFDGATVLQNTISYTTILVIILSIGIGILIPVLVLRPIRTTNIVVEELSRGEGDLTVRMTENNNEMGVLRGNINKFIIKISDIVVNVKNSANRVASSSNELNRATSEANRNIETISREVQSITSEIEHNSSAVEEVTASVQEMAQSASEVGEDANVLLDNAKEVTQAVQMGSTDLDAVSESVNLVKINSKEVTGEIEKLESYSNEIESIIGLITGISQQTNLLALNASIEAARAGEHGRGFAVVAEEVRKLAVESSQSTEQISKLIGMIRHMVGKTKESIQNEAVQIDRSVEMTTTANEAFKGIILKVDRMEERIGHISELTQHQSEVTDQIARAMDEVAKVTTNNAGSARQINENVENQVAIFEEIGASLDELHRIAENLEEETERFKV